MKAAGYPARLERSFPSSDGSAEHTICFTFNEKIHYVVSLAVSDGGWVLNAMLLFWTECSDGQHA